MRNDAYLTWNRPCINAQNLLVTKDCLYGLGEGVDLITLISTPENLRTPLQVFDAIRALDAHMAQEAVARANMVKLLNNAMGEVVYS